MKFSFKKLLSALFLTAFLSVSVQAGTPIMGNTLGFGVNQGSGAAASTFKVASGSYVVSDTGGDQVITGLGFTPKLVIIKETTTDGSPVITWNGLGGAANYGSKINNVSIPQTGNSGMPKSLDSDGFTIKSGAGNCAGVGLTYYYVAITGSASEIYAGNYTGNATDNTDITGVGFSANFIYITQRITTARAAFRFSSQTGDNSFGGASGAEPTQAAPAANLIQSISSDGFQIGSDAIVNTSSKVYDFIAIKIPASAGQVGSYLGTSIAQDITLTSGITPTYVMVKNESTGANGNMIARGSGNADGKTSLYNDSAANITQGITALNAGTFTVGTGARANGTAVTHHFMAFKTAP